MPPAAHIILEHVLIHIKSPKCSDIKMSSWSWLCNNSLMFSIHCSCLISEEDTAGRLYWGPVQPAPERTSLSFTIRICILGWNFGHILLYGFAQCRFCTRYIFWDTFERYATCKDLLYPGAADPGGLGVGPLELGIYGVTISKISFFLVFGPLLDKICSIAPVYAF